jgi:hypothetical protein
MPFYLFFGLFNDTANWQGHTVSNHQWKMNWKWCERKRLWPRSASAWRDQGKPQKTSVRNPVSCPWFEHRTSWIWSRDANSWLQFSGTDSKTVKQAYSQITETEKWGWRNSINSWKRKAIQVFMSGMKDYSLPGIRKSLRSNKPVLWRLRTTNRIILLITFFFQIIHHF